MAPKAAVIGGGGAVVALVITIIVVIVVVLLQSQKQTPQTPTPAAPITQAPSPAPGPVPSPMPVPEPTPSPSPVYAGPQSSLSVGAPPAPAIQQIGLAAAPATQGQVATLIDILPDLLTGIGIGLAVEAVLHLDVIALKIVTRMMRTPALKAELKLARAAVAERTLTGRMSKAFGRMGVLARAKMGLRWGRTAAQSGETAATSKLRAAAEAASLSADNGARLMAEEIAQREAKGAALSSIANVFDAAAIVGLALDMTNTGNYSQLVSTEDLRNMKAANDSEVVNTTIACSTWPLSAGCPQSPSPAPAPAPGPAPPPPAPHQGRYPMFVGPLDAWAADTLDLAISNEFVRVFTSENPPQSVKDLIADVSSRISTDLGVDTISDTLFIMLCNQYLTPIELENIHNLAFDNICVTEGGASFMPGNGYDRVCSYKTKDACHAASQWPLPSDDSKDITYTEWRAKPWFSQWNTIEPTNIPTDGACISADPSIHQMCDEEIGTASGRATNRYIRETGECVNTRDVCRIKGVSYRDSDPPTCYVTEGQNIAELLFGSTIVRFFISGGKLKLHPDLITTVVTVTIPPANSGNSTVDTAVNTVSSGLASASSEIANAGITAANAIQTGVLQTVNDVVNSAVAGVNAIISGVTNMPSASAASAGLLNPNTSGLVCTDGKVKVSAGPGLEACCFPGQSIVNGICACPPDKPLKNNICTPCDESKGEFLYNGECITKSQCPVCSLNQVVTGTPKSCECVCPDGKFKFQGAPRENGVDYYPTDIPLGKCISQSECPYKPSGFGFTEMDSCKLGCPSGKTYIDGTEFYYPPVGTITYGVSGGSAPAGCYTDINEKKQKAIDDFNTRNAQGQLTAWQNRAALKVCPAGQEGALDPSITPVQGSWRDVICRPCSDNSYKDTNMAGSCTPCPLGGSTGKTGSTTSTDCRTCPSGQVWNLNTNSCKCFGSLQIFNSDKTACVDCPAGQKPNAAGTVCEAICPAGQIFQGWSGCQPCPIDKISNPHTNTCDSCPSGKIVNKTTNTCYSCTGKQYLNTVSKVCVDCPTNQVPNSDHTTCVSCPSGQFINKNGYDCVSCPTGQVYSADRDGCVGCEANMTFDSSIGGCNRCLAGQIPNINRIGCVACPSGQYVSPSGETCEYCPAGQIWNGTLNWCEYCPINTYNTDGKTCLPCPSGQISNATKTGCVPAPSFKRGDPINGFTLIYKNDSETTLTTPLSTSGLPQSTSISSSVGQVSSYFNLDAEIPNLISSLSLSNYNYILIFILSGSPMIAGNTYLSLAFLTGIVYTNKRIYIYKKN